MSCILSRSSYLETYSMTYAAKAKTQQFIRRKSNLVKKADQLARLCHADLVLIINTKDGLTFFWIELESDQIHLLTSAILIEHCWIAGSATTSIVEIRIASVSWISQASTIIWITPSSLYGVRRYLTAKQTSALNDLLPLYITFGVINRVLLPRCLVDQICMRKGWMSKQSEWKRKILWRGLQGSMNSKWKCEWVRQWPIR